MLDPSQARRRQKRMLDVLQARQLDAAVFGWSKNVYYFTAHFPFWQHHVGLVLFADGRSVLITANKPDNAATADEVRSYEATWNGTQRQDQPSLVGEALAGAVAERRAERIGIDSSAATAMFSATAAKSCIPIDADVWQLRRRKDPDELALMKVAIDCTAAMYRRARQIIEPGIGELDVFNALQDAAVAVAGEPLSDYLGNDYACGVPGGPPHKDRRAEAGQLYILDLGPAYRGYFSDNARTISVDRRPTDPQMEAWRLVTGTFPIVQRMARAGTRCRDIFQAVDAYYRETCGKPFPHHLGHGVGLQPHEFPHLNPKWDDVLIEGEIFTCEPGFYGPELAGGLRIENQYLVRADRIENLTPFPMEYV